MPRIAFLLQPRTVLSGVTVPAEMFRAAEQLDRLHYRRRRGLELALASTEPDPAPLIGGLGVRSQIPLDELPGYDIVIVPPVWRRLLTRHGREQALAAVREIASGSGLLCAVSTGTFLVAEAGVLDGRAATTHWSYLDEFAHRYPAVDLKRDHLTTRSGSIYCASSLNAVADLTGHFIELLYDAQIARQASLQFSPEIRRSPTEHAFFEGEVNRHADETIVLAQEKLEQGLAEPNDFDRIARELGLSRRSFNRRFRRATGTTPVSWLRERRMRHASELLRRTNLSIAEVAERVGYGQPAYFATQFRSWSTVAPTAYRRTVRAKLFEPVAQAPPNA